MDEKCIRCNGTYHVQYHHIKPRATGGDDADNNLVPLCGVCHDDIHTGVTNESPARLTGDEFEEWINEDVPEQRWESEYVCGGCGYRWTGKPVLERKSTTIKCPRDGHILYNNAFIEVGNILLRANGIRSVMESGNTINYTGCEFDRRRSPDNNRWRLGEVQVYDEPIVEAREK